MNTLLGENFSGPNFIPQFPAYAAFFDQLINTSPAILVDRSPDLMKLCVKMVNAGLDLSFFQIFNAVFTKLSLQDLTSSQWLGFLIDSANSVIGNCPQGADRGYRPLYFKEFGLMLCRFGIHHGWSGSNSI